MIVHRIRGCRHSGQLVGDLCLGKWRPASPREKLLFAMEPVMDHGWTPGEGKFFTR